MDISLLHKKNINKRFFLVLNVITKNRRHFFLNKMKMKMKNSLTHLKTKKSLDSK